MLFQGPLKVKSDLRVKSWSLPLVPLPLVNFTPLRNDLCASPCQLCCAPCQFYAKEPGGNWQAIERDQKQTNLTERVAGLAVEKQ